MSQILIVLAVIVLAVALRSFRHPLSRKGSAICILVASYLTMYFITGSHVAGIAGVLMWFLLPWIELLTRIRKMRLPVHKQLEKQAPPNARRFPSLEEITNEIENEDFEHVSDSGWNWEHVSQFYRIFYRKSDRLQATICFTEQDSVAYAYIALNSRTEKGETLRTWNFPFSSTMKIAPDVKMNRVSSAESFGALLGSHQKFLESLGVNLDSLCDDRPELIPQLIEKETGQQIRHNLDRGLIELAEQPDMFRYSWRGLFFLYGQLVKDLVKLS